MHPQHLLNKYVNFVRTGSMQNLMLNVLTSSSSHFIIGEGFEVILSKKFDYNKAYYRSMFKRINYLMLGCQGNGFLVFC